METKYNELFSRNIGIVTEKEQEKLSNSRIAIAGVGGVGGIQLAILARAGIGKFNIADPEVFNPTDRNRQYGAKESTVGKNKALEMEKIVKDINPYGQLKTFHGVNSDNISEFIKDAEVVIDAIEYFTVDEKIRLYKEARKNNKFVFTSPIIGFGSSLLIFDPNGMTYEEYFSLNENNKKLGFERLCPIYPDYMDKNLYTDAANKKRPIPSFSASTALSAGLLTTEVVLFLLGKREPAVAPKCTLVDYYRQSFDVIMNRNWKDFWSKFSREAYDNIGLLPENKRMLSRIAELAGTNKKVLDAGCGTGNLTIKLAENNDVTGIDFSPGMIEATLEKTKTLDNVAVKQGDVNSLQFPDKTFDVVTSVNVFFNLENPEKAIKEAHRVLKDDGLFIVSSPLKHEGLTKEFLDKVFADGKQVGVEKERIMKILEFNKILFEEQGMKFTPDFDEIAQLLCNNNFRILNTEEAYYGTNFLILGRKENEKRRFN